MNLRSVFMASAALLVLSAPAWGDSMKFKSAGDSPIAIHFNQGSNKFHSNLKFLGGFKHENSKKHDGFFKIKKGHFVLNAPTGRFEQPSGSNDGPSPSTDPVSTPEPAALSLLLFGFIGLGVLAYRRVPSLIGAQ